MPRRELYKEDEEKLQILGAFKALKSVIKQSRNLESFLDDFFCASKHSWIQLKFWGGKFQRKDQEADLTKAFCSTVIWGLILLQIDPAPWRSLARFSWSSVGGLDSELLGVLLLISLMAGSDL